MILLEDFKDFEVVPFIEKFDFDLKQEELQVTLSKEPIPAAKRYQHLHFHCYGLEAEYNEQIQEIYNKP